MTFIPIYFHGSISRGEIEEALRANGLHLRRDGRGRILADRVPRSLRRSLLGEEPVDGLDAGGALANR